MNIYRSGLVLVGAALVMQACASHPGKEVQDQMARTEAVLDQADRSGVAVHALPELQAAKDKYAEAERLLEKESDEASQKALQLAKEAEVDAQYATAKARTKAQENTAREVQSGVDALRDEASRNAAATTATP
jgi:predicted amidohydrolase